MPTDSVPISNASGRDEQATPGAPVEITVTGKEQAWGERRTAFLSEIIEAQPRSRATPKDDLPYFSPATFADNHRENDNYEAGFAVGFDVDEEHVTREALESLPYAGWYHTSPSHTPNAPRWHLFVLTDRPMRSSDEYRATWGTVEASLPFKVGQQAKNPGRGWTVPREPAEGAYVFGRLTGKPTPVLSGTATVEREAPDKPSPETGTAVFSADLPERYHARAKQTADALVKLAPSNGRHAGMMAVAGAVCGGIVEGEHVPAFVMCVRGLAGWDTSHGKRADAADTVRNKLAGRAVTGFPYLRENGWGAVADALDAPSERDRELMRALMAAVAATGPANDTPATKPAWKASTPGARVRRLIGRGKVARLKTGFPTLDNVLRGGLPMGTFGVLGGAPGAGKTTTGVQIAWNALQAGARVGIYASDESDEGLLIRLGQILGFDRTALETGDPTVCEAAASALDAIPNLMIVDADEDDVSIEELSAELRRRANGTPGLMIVDSIQTAADRLDASRPKRDRIDAVVKALKHCAKVDRHVVMATSEVTRNTYGTQDPTKQVSDLAAFKESGGIEYGVQLALVLRSREGCRGVIDVTTPKNRIGTERPDFALRLDEQRATVEEEQGLPKPDPLRKWKDNIRDAVRKSPGRVWAISALKTEAGGNATKLGQAINAMLDDRELLHETGRGVSVYPRGPLWPSSAA